MKRQLITLGLGLLAVACSDDSPGATRVGDAEEGQVEADGADQGPGPGVDADTDNAPDAVDGEDVEGEDVEADVPSHADDGTLADADEAVDSSWREGIPAGLSTTVTFSMHCELVACNPTCGQPLGSSAEFTIALAVPEAGPIMLTFATATFAVAFEPVAVNPDGSFGFFLDVDQTAATNAYTITGHVGPGRSLTVDSYSFMILQTNGFMAGWTTTSTATAPQTQQF